MPSSVKRKTARQNVAALNSVNNDTGLPRQIPIEFSGRTLFAHESLSILWSPFLCDSFSMGARECFDMTRMQAQILVIEKFVHHSFWRWLLMIKPEP